MASRERYIPRKHLVQEIVPFGSAEEVWFWFIQAQQARGEGARYVAGRGVMARPCEPVDILKIIDRLYRQRRLLRDHLLVLRHYGRRLMPPDPRRVKEARAHKLWREAMERLSPAFEHKGIVLRRGWSKPPRIANSLCMTEGVAAE